MYEIELSNDNGATWQKVHEANTLSDRRVKACTFSRGVSAIQAADFQLLATNPTYTVYHEHTTLVRIRNTKNGSLAFDGFVAKVYNDGMDSSGVVQKSVSCDGCLAWLNDTIQMYRKFDNIPLGEVLLAMCKAVPLGFLWSIMRTFQNMRESIKELSNIPGISLLSASMKARLNASRKIFWMLCRALKSLSAVTVRDVWS